MAREDSNRTYPLEEAVKAQKRLRQAAGLEPEQFPVEAFVGMISDEIEALRAQGRTDEQISEPVQKLSESAQEQVSEGDVDHGFR